MSPIRRAFTLLITTLSTTLSLSVVVDSPRRAGVRKVVLMVLEVKKFSRDQVEGEPDAEDVYTLRELLL
jgi:hypothetical protein